MVEVSRTEATRFVEEDSDFKKYPLLQKYIEISGDKIHFE
jgi:hypothetical protein